MRKFSLQQIVFTPFQPEFWQPCFQATMQLLPCSMPSVPRRARKKKKKSTKFIVEKSKFCIQEIFFNLHFAKHLCTGNIWMEKQLRIFPLPFLFIWL